MKRSDLNKISAFSVAMIILLVIKTIGIEKIPYQILILILVSCIYVVLRGVMKANVGKKTKMYFVALTIVLIIGGLAFCIKVILRNYFSVTQSYLYSILSFIMLGTFILTALIVIYAAINKWGIEEKNKK